MQDELFTVEFDNGEILDTMGDGGYSVFTTRAEAQDALETEESSMDDPSVTVSIVRYVREAGA